ncbi:hypothetical protein [Streptomyces sp. SudanB182_2057]|uniref:hypothetical protein n=1 Tax=Streptomyces sp. SudanB182_2057 TaxID=3035281 RepID=UPI003F55ACDC
MCDPVTFGLPGSAPSPGAADVEAGEGCPRGAAPPSVRAFGHAPGHLPVGSLPWNLVGHGLESMAHRVATRASVGQAIVHHARRPATDVRGQQ